MSYTPPTDLTTAADTKTPGTVAPSTPQRDPIPDLVRIGTIPTNSSIDIDTDILDPVVNTDTFCRFQFQNKGILHSHSKIAFRFGINATDAYAPANVGIHSIIERCRLLVGTKTLSEIDDFNHYVAYKSAFMSNEHQKEREQVTSGRVIAHRVAYDDSANASNGAQSNNSASFISLDTGYNVSATTNNGSAVGGPAALGDTLLAPFQKTNATYGGPEYQIAIADLFPFLYSNQLPLYMMKEPVTIELTFAPAAKRRLATFAGATSATEMTFDLTATKLIADYQYFPQEMMEQYAEQNRDMSFSYVDYRLAKRTVTTLIAGSEVATPQTIMNIGAAGRICSKVITMLSNDKADPETSMTMIYNSTGPQVDYTSGSNIRSNGKCTTNIKYNNQFLYPVDIDNPCRHFYQVTQAEGMVPFVTREEYSAAGNLATNQKFEGKDQGNLFTGLPNKFFYQAYHLNRSERINSRGIEYYFAYDTLANQSGGATDSYTMRTYVELLKMATLRDGVISTFYA